MPDCPRLFSPYEHFQQGKGYVRRCLRAIGGDDVSVYHDALVFYDLYAKFCKLLLPVPAPQMVGRGLAPLQDAALDRKSVV